jgi:hypothetical protein
MNMRSRTEPRQESHVTFEEHLTEFAGLPVVEFPLSPKDPPPEAVPDAVAWRVRIDAGWGAGEGASRDFEERFGAFLDQVDTSRVAALLTGITSYEDEYDGETPVRLLAEHAAAFPALRALFLADVVREESDVAYIQHEDLMPVFEAFPALEEFHVRGSGYSWERKTPFRPFAHSALRTLVFESGGLSPTVIRAVGECDLPALEHLEFYFGDQNYDGGAAVADIEWLLAGEKFPKLRHLGLRDAPNQDEIAAAVAHAPIVARLASLDLSLGTLGDEGAAALLAGQPLTHLARLDLHHHFLSDEMALRLVQALPGVEVNVEGKAEPTFWNGESHRYIAISE